MSREVDNRHSFRPRGLLAGGHVQSILTSGPWRRWKVRRQASDYLARSQREVVTTEQGVQLLGFRNHSVHQPASGLVILLHGWEGSSESNYLLSAASSLDQAGFDTVRLNFRDHGESHHLNLDLFHSCRLQEVLDAVAELAGNYRHGPVFLVGFSLGGNFALRVARYITDRDVALDRVVAVSPVVRPHHVLDALEGGLSLYQTYFERKWGRSLKIKQHLYPEHYRFDDWFRLKGLRARTEWLVEHCTDFPHLDAYLEGYAIDGDFLDDLETSSLIVTAADDPIIPASDFRRLARPRALEVEIHQRGGHCGFIENWRLDSWIERRLVKELAPWQKRNVERAS